MASCRRAAPFVDHRVGSTTMSLRRTRVLTNYLASMEIPTICEWNVGGGLGSRLAGPTSILGPDTVLSDDNHTSSN